MSPLPYYPYHHTHIQANNQQRATHISAINQEKAAIQNLAPDIDKQREAFTNLKSTMMDASIAMAGLAAMSEGGISNIASVMSGVLMMGAGIMTMIETIDKLEWKSIILAIIKAGPMILMGAFTAIKTLIDALLVAQKEMMAEKINEKYKHYIRINGIPEDEKDEFISLHDAYKGVGGNHHGDEKFNYCIEHLKVIPVETKLILNRLKNEF